MITKHLHSHQKACHSASCAAPRCFIYPKRFGASNHSFSKHRPYLLPLYSTIIPSYHNTIIPSYHHTIIPYSHLMIPPAISMFISGVKTFGQRNPSLAVLPVYRLRWSWPSRSRESSKASIFGQFSFVCCGHE
jgi:hypothetical protein